MPKQISNKTLLNEIKRDEWRKKIGEEEYSNNSLLIKQICNKNLDIVAKKNRNFKPRKYVKPPTTSRRVSFKARDAYRRWKEKNPITKKPCPSINVQDLLVLLHYLNSQPDETTDNYIDCLKQQNPHCGPFWDSPMYILHAIRKCILQRDWTKMTYFLSFLLNYNNRYLHIVKNMCNLMAKFDPLVKESKLEDFFTTVQNSDQQIVIV